jgi:hypothetical protein
MFKQTFKLNLIQPKSCNKLCKLKFQGCLCMDGDTTNYVNKNLNKIVVQKIRTVSVSI